MHKKAFLISLVLSAALFVFTAAAEDVKPVKGEDLVLVPAITDGLCVNNIFQSNMVLQRDKPIAVWGWAGPGEKVTVSFADQEKSVTAGDDRSWKVELTALPASSVPRKMTIKGKDKTIELENILIGDVWLLGGQSNMEFEIAKIDRRQATRTLALQAALTRDDHGSIRK